MKREIFLEVTDNNKKVFQEFITSLSGPKGYLKIDGKDFVKKYFGTIY